MAFSRSDTIDLRSNTISYDSVYDRITISLRSIYDRFTIGPRSIYDRFTIKIRSEHDQKTIEFRSNDDQLTIRNDRFTIDLRSVYDQRTIAYDQLRSTRSITIDLRSIYDRFSIGFRWILDGFGTRLLVFYQKLIIRLRILMAEQFVPHMHGHCRNESLICDGSIMRTVVLRVSNEWSCTSTGIISICTEEPSEFSTRNYASHVKKFYVYEEDKILTSHTQYTHRRNRSLYRRDI